MKCNLLLGIYSYRKPRRSKHALFQVCFFSALLGVFVLGYSCFITFCWLLLYKEVNWLCVCVCVCVCVSPSSWTSSHNLHPPTQVATEHPAELPVLCCRCLLFTCQSTHVNSNLSVHPTLPHSAHVAILCICISSPALQVSPSVPFSRFHIYALINDMWSFFHDLLHSV